MHVFVTGATGYIGSAIVRDLQEAGHSVLGLARSDRSADTLRQAGADVHRGDVTDLESLAAGARAADGVVHTAFVHDFSDYEESTRTDERAVLAIAAALEDTGKPFVATSGAGVSGPGGPGRLVTEDDPAAPETVPRGRSEAALGAARRGVRTSVVRLPPTVHGPGDDGFVPAVVRSARSHGASPYVGDGLNRWPAVHRLDAARLFRLALEHAEPGMVLHGVAEEGIAFREIAQIIGDGLGVPVRSLSPDEAAGHFAWMAPFVQMDSAAASARTRSRVGWQPREVGLLTDLQQSGYFDAARTADA